MVVDAKRVNPKRGWFIQIGVSKETFDKLDKLKGEAGTKLRGVRLSWNEFIRICLPEIERVVKGLKS